MTPPPAGVQQPWDRWIPDIVIEVVSASSSRRDYNAKPKDHLSAGVREYWIMDPLKRRGVFMTRRADMWLKKILGIRGRWRTSLLPDFALELSGLFSKKRDRK